VDPESGLPLRVVRSVDNETRTAVGVAGYREQVQLDLVSTDPV
jgi:hydrogenase maturation factor